MRKTKKLINIFVLAVFFSMAITSSFVFVSAEILLSNPEEIYNLGDILNISVSASGKGLLSVELICPTIKNTILIKYILESGEENAIMPLEKATGTGNCYVSASLGDDSVKTVEFIITNRIDIIVNLNKLNFRPSEILIINGTAVKANSHLVEGNATIKILDIAETYRTEIVNGTFLLEIELPENAIPGEHIVSIEVSEGENKGVSTKKIFVEQVPTSLEIFLDKTEVKPQDKILIRTIIYDQVKQIMDRDVKILLKNSKDRFVFEEIISSNDALAYVFPSAAIAGSWKLQAESSGVKKEKVITVEEYEAIDAFFINNTLVIENIGNVPYKKSLEIIFINSTGKQIIEIPSLDLDSGKEKNFKLEAPSGIYNITIENKTFGGIPLTGKATSAIEIGKKGFLERNPVTSLIILVLVILAIVLFSFYRRKKEKQFSKQQYSQ